jgi:RecA/RadA recombinase
VRLVVYDSVAAYVRRAESEVSTVQQEN